MRFATILFLAPLGFGNLSAQSALSARTDSVMKAAEQAGFSGVVRLEQNGAVVLKKAYGLAIKDPATPFTPNTVVQVGSNTKDFTAVAILQLQEKGKLDLHDPIGKYFPRAPADKRGITILQLLKHQAGFPLGLGGDFEPVGRAELINNAMNFKLLFTPGERSSYSNTGYSLLAAIIEQVTGKSYDVYVRDNILKPLGLTHTGFLLPGFRTVSLAHGYMRTGDDAGTMLAKPHAPDGPYWNLRGNGGMLSTVDDMHAFYKALFESEKLIKASSRAVMFKVDQPIGLAGSDNVNFFLYDRDPIARTEMIIASTNAAYRAPMVRQALASVLGLPTAVGGPEFQPAPRPKGNPPAAEVQSLIKSFVEALNSGDNKILLGFVTEHFESGGDAPKPEERVGRMVSLHQNVGDITIEQMIDTGNGPIQVAARTKNEGAATLIVDVDRSLPYKIKRIGLQVGGD